MRETDFYQRHVTKMKGPLHLERIENAVGTGTPDVNSAGGGKQFWIETKVEKSGFIYFEKFQLPWFKKRLRYTNGKGLFIMALVDNDTEINVWHPADVLEAKREPYKKWIRIAMTDMPEPLFMFHKPWPKEMMERLAHSLIELS